jgi:uncharacterized membrane protein
MSHHLPRGRHGRLGQQKEDDALVTAHASKPSRFPPHPYRSRDPHREVQERLGRQDRIALRITRAMGTMYAVYALAIFMLGWMLVQSFLGGGAFDPYPFVFLLFLANVVQLLLMPLIMVGQNLQGRHAEARATVEFETVTKTFADLESVLAHLDEQDREAKRLADLLEALLAKASAAEAAGAGHESDVQARDR